MVKCGTEYRLNTAYFDHSNWPEVVVIPGYNL